MAALDRLPKWSPGSDSIPSKVSELDVFVTGTDVAGSVRTVFDDGGHAIDVKDHRAVFHLEFRESLKNDFDPRSAKELATLARLTSCFPVAFAPVELSPSTHEQLARWGQLKEPSMFLDGGILDNKPFSYAINTIFGRKADRDVQRLLFYVEPNPERFASARKPVVPGAISSAMLALIGIPGYESIALDLESIANHNETIVRLEGMIRHASLSESRKSETLNDTVSTVHGIGEDCHIYLTSRISQLRNRAVEGILNEGKRRPFFARSEERRAARILVDSFSEWTGSVESTLDQFDVFFRIRRLYHLTYCLKEFICGGDVPLAQEREERSRRLWRDINHYISLFEVVQAEMESLVDHAAIEWSSLDAQFRRDGEEVEPSKGDLARVADRMWGQIADALISLLTVDSITEEIIRDPTLQKSFAAAVRARCSKATVGCAPGESANILERIDREVRALLDRYDNHVPDNPIVRVYCAFVNIDRQIFPLQYAANTHTRDIIQVVRLSPVDARRGLSARAIDAKICGRTLGSFGGFFKKPWRSNDIMWGRLDALCQIVECTFTKERLRKVRRWAASLPEIEARLIRVFKTAERQTIKHLAGRLWNVDTLTDNEFDALTTALIEAGQREIVAAEWPQVIADALEQERQWGHHHVVELSPTSSFFAERLAWKPAVQSHDGLIVLLAARAAADPQLNLFNDYAIAGRPFLDEIPKPVLLELGTLAMMRLERSVRSELPKWQRFRVRFLHGILFGWVLPTLYGWARFSRTAPEYAQSLAVSVLASSLVAFGLGLALLWTGVNGLIVRWMVSASAVLITIWILFFRRR